MAKKPAKRRPESGPEDTDAAVAGKVRSARGLLMAALVLAAGSLGGGFFLARMAYVSDAAGFEPDYVEAGGSGEAGAEAPDEGGEDDSADETVGLDGLLEFEDIMTDITSYDQQGSTARSFLKLSLILVYRPEPGARELVEERQPFMRDLFTTYARSLTEPEVRGAAGLLTVKAELLKRARAATGNNLPQDVLIKDLIVQ
ncbi:flagellar basal body-associated FliL family protein [Aestuariivita sp.]|jgi:flagellar basal body-associated protein FliL|uniref:flagellar basal body-associated FliL family protein n=1 Tax=Aestuariivita sp. TaxID=1872407 RepID=UPI00216EC6A6|nr:flagellar basal body-associated FliL family protein [Aestuariivita sp.]MCE8008972.1 flagellar basal body-associated FliL family protein [Aestuariivita sp.]